MKKLLLSITALFVLGVSAVSAQGFQGKWWLMGQAGFASSNDGNTKDYSILPVFGYFVAPTTTIGLGIGYAGQTEKVGDDKTTTGKFIVQPLARKYWPVNEKLLIFGQAAVPLEFGKTTKETSLGKTDSKYTEYGIQIAPGIDYFLADNLSIEGSFAVAQWTAHKPKDGDTTNEFKINVDSGFLSGIKLGIKLFF